MKNRANGTWFSHLCLTELIMRNEYWLIFIFARTIIRRKLSTSFQSIRFRSTTMFFFVVFFYIVIGY